MACRNKEAIRLFKSIQTDYNDLLDLAYIEIECEQEKVEKFRDESLLLKTRIDNAIYFLTCDKYKYPENAIQILKGIQDVYIKEDRYQKEFKPIDDFEQEQLKNIEDETAGNNCDRTSCKYYNIKADKNCSRSSISNTISCLQQGYNLYEEI